MTKISLPTYDQMMNPDACMHWSTSSVAPALYQEILDEVASDILETY